MRVVLCNCPTAAAGKIARALVQRRLAACVNAIPGVVSTYEWDGRVCEDEETTLVIKTRSELFDALCAAVVELHPYEVPEIIALPILEGHRPYLDWLTKVTTAGAASMKVPKSSNQNSGR